MGPGSTSVHHIKALRPVLIHIRPFTNRPCRMAPLLQAPDVSHASQTQHVRQVAEQLKQHGILKISLQFPDPESIYLRGLLFGLHHHHGHQLPITHSAERGWFWDVRPSTTTFQAVNHQARSETMENFPWHTDCSYETLPPRYFALHILQHDRFGGGTLSVMNVEGLCKQLSPATRSALTRPEYRITIPAEFIKDPERRYIIGGLLADDSNTASALIRFRGDIVTPLSHAASQALIDLNEALENTSIQEHSTLRFPAEELPKDSIVLIDNRRWLHARTYVKDPQRHLRRVRWDAVPFEVTSN
ncbi:hypothetical protein S7711_06257 [Stachybotrys chartarum IBT 7711]|uniref:TauD/TfdA-like domain-containing protein n=1 Tax=Stachybotrys chartarum (strain CBS 109288 / IBT 7711) TaxID=1280523 RepID=A0A084B4Z3_STACB|nr:hypothetical protein S7711_06257 [Stachybotrys chartarum IBT 7711]